MVRLCTGSDNAMNFVWIEDYSGDRSRIVDWDFDNETLEGIVKKFDERTLKDEDCCSEWEQGAEKVRKEMNGFTVLSWHE
ncbi:MAG: hypothetical protein IJH78_06710 [Clostridia bacterium]|nr:hypothetical protein [Clostridia bacterium]